MSHNDHHATTNERADPMPAVAPTPTPRPRPRTGPAALVTKPTPQPRRRPCLMGECPICLDEETKPVVALSGCTHAVCTHCYPRLPSRICPVCRAPFVVPTKGKLSRTGRLTRLRRRIRSWYDGWCEETELNPHPHQLSGIQWAAAIEAGLGPSQITIGGILADEMGLGKTMTTLALMMFAQMNNQLIVVPKALLAQWRDVIQHRLKHTPLVVHGPKAHKLTAADIAGARIVLTTYGMITRRSRPSATHLLLSEQPWGRVVFDEAHHLRNRKTAFLGARALTTDHLWLLTGTPIQNSRADLMAYWTLLGVPATVFVMPGAERQLINNHILRRTKASLGLDMAAPVSETIRCGWQDHGELDISDQFHSSLKCLGRAREAPVRRGVQVFGSQVLAAMVRCRQSCVNAELYLGELREWEQRRQTPGEAPLPPMQTGSKLQDVCEHIMNQHRADSALPQPKRRRRLVFCHYLGAMDYIQQALELQGLSVAQISGKTAMAERLRLTQEPVDALILQIRSGCEGLNLQAYADVYLVTPHWNPAVEEQAIGRCHRMGQEMEVRVYQFIMEATGEAGVSLDAYCARTQEKKRLAAAIIKTRTW